MLGFALAHRVLSLTSQATFVRPRATKLSWVCIHEFLEEISVVVVDILCHRQRGASRFLWQIRPLLAVEITSSMFPRTQPSTQN